MEYLSVWRIYLEQSKNIKDIVQANTQASVIVDE